MRNPAEEPGDQGRGLPSRRKVPAASKNAARLLASAARHPHLRFVENRLLPRFLMETGRFRGMVSLMTSNDVCRGKTRPGRLRCLREQ